VTGALLVSTVKAPSTICTATTATDTSAGPRTCRAFGPVGQASADVEVAAGSEVRHQLAALLAIVQVKDGGGGMVDFQGGGVAENQHLDQRRSEHKKAAAFVPEDLYKLFG